MSTPLSPEEDIELDEFDDEETPDDAIAGVSAWGVSIVTHAVVIALMAFVVFMVRNVEDQAPIHIVTVDPPTHEEEKEKPRIDDVKVDVDIPEIQDEIVIHELEVIEDIEVETEDEVEAETPVKGREEAVAKSEMGGAFLFQAIGAGGGAAGYKGRKDGGGKRLRMKRYGAPPEAGPLVNRALRWFMRHQSPNGQWDVDGYQANCTLGGVKCEPGRYKTNIEGDVACTGYALLCFLGDGHTHRWQSRYQRTVKKGIDWLLATQTEAGLLGKRNYEHAIATMALCEALAMTEDPHLRDPCQRAVNVILERQAKDDGYGLGWDYIKPNPARIDSSVSGWNVMALKAAKTAGLDVGDGLDGAKNWLVKAWTATNPNTENLDLYTDETQFPYCYNATNDQIKRPGAMTCVGAVCSVFLDGDAEDPMLRTMGNYIHNHMKPTRWPTDTYYLYYNSLAMFQIGGDQWKDWNNSVAELLVDSQRKDEGCFDGSWDPQGAGGHHVAEVGRLLVTAYACLSMEVYWRYIPLHEKDQAKQKELKKRTLSTK